MLTCLQFNCSRTCWSSSLRFSRTVPVIFLCFSKRWFCLASPSIHLGWYYRASSSFLSSPSSSILSLKFSWCGFKASPLMDTIFQNLDDISLDTTGKDWIMKILQNIKILERTMPSFLHVMWTLVVKETYPQCYLLLKYKHTVINNLKK